ncbi:hypothetical protein, partial [Bacillus paralicheniformis]
ERVARKLSLDGNADFWDVPQDARATWKRASLTDTAGRLQGMVTIKQERETRLVHIRVRDRNGERASLLANAIADAY